MKDIEYLLKEREESILNKGIKTNEDNILLANKNASYKDFLDMVSKLVVEDLKDKEVQFMHDDDAIRLINKHKRNETVENSIISYKLLRRSKISENKPRVRREISEKAENRLGMLYGQQFNYMVNFKVYSTNTMEADEVLDRFEDIMQQYLHYLKKNGVQEIMFDEQEEDKNVIIQDEIFSIRSITYRVQIDKMTVIFNGKIDETFITNNNK